MMSNKMRPIDADKLMKRFRIVAQSGGPVMYHVSDICATIEDEAAEESVDAVEVVHGEWISWEKADNYIPSPDRHECSVCHDAAQVLVNGFELLSPYCPNCGAKMDGGSHETD